MAHKEILVTIFLASALYQLGNCQELPTQRTFLSDLLEIAQEFLEEVVERFLLAVTVPEENVKFLLYSPSTNQTTAITSHQSLNPQNPTKILIHGFNSNARQSWVQEMAFLYHQKGPHNVIAVDWSLDANKTYLYSSSVVRGVGMVVGQFILNVTNHVPEFLQSVHLIGHSLGSHVAGFAGKRVASGNKGLIDRITGLDAAGPLFEIPVVRPADLRIDQSDANFVDLIHTAGGLFGVSDEYGTVDFYVNKGGPVQPACGTLGIIGAITCSHSYAHVVFRRTIEDPERYEGVPRGNARLGNKTVFMGDGVSRSASGNFFVDIQ